MKDASSSGDSNWIFYNAAFKEASVSRITASMRFYEAGCAKPVATIKLTVKDKERRAIVVNAPDDANQRPAVIVLHGGMGSAAQMRATSGFDAVAKANGFMVVYAEGTILVVVDMRGTQAFSCCGKCRMPMTSLTLIR